MEHFVSTVALIGIVIVVAALLSGAVERSGVPIVAVFLALGAALGPWGLGLANIDLDSSVLESVATLALALVLFSDAVTLDLKEVRSRRRLALRLLGPGTLAPAVVIALAAWGLLGISVPAAAILGAALASTDPVLLRSVLRSRALPGPTRVALRLESGMNDAVLLPIVILAMVIEHAGAPGQGSVATVLIHRAVGLFLLGPALGALVGLVGIIVLGRVRGSIGVRRDYESLYALGLAFTAYAVAESVGGSGFLAAFAAGLLVAAQDIELCDCFLEYGEATAEMLLLLTFVALGMSVIWSGLGVIDVRTIVFAVVALAARTVVLLPMLKGVGLTARERRLIALFGPRGLSSLLFTLLPVFAGVPGAGYLFAVACLVVLLSVLLHGSGMALFLRASHRGRTDARAATSKEDETDHAPDAATPAPDRITIAEVQALLSRGENILPVDSRADRSYRASDLQARGAVRLPPEDPVRDATEMRLSRHATLVVYCA
ncbi:MAG TPA: cation:proton antiporter [Gemmatimonadaceae bacterium]|jgi:NhaP-type Na+/H+ or K+/H+ antiporter|nr:cation:proton antiporter [Gemmatimonadaceae bacterium]